MSQLCQSDVKLWLSDGRCHVKRCRCKITVAWIWSCYGCFLCLFCLVSRDQIIPNPNTTLFGRMFFFCWQDSDLNPASVRATRFTISRRNLILSSDSFLCGKLSFITLCLINIRETVDFKFYYFLHSNKISLKQVFSTIKSKNISKNYIILPKILKFSILLDSLKNILKFSIS